MVDDLVYYAPQLCALMIAVGILIAIILLIRLHKVNKKYRLLK